MSGEETLNKIKTLFERNEVMEPEAITFGPEDESGFTCRSCGKIFREDSNFCPNCGQRWREKDEYAIDYS